MSFDQKKIAVFLDGPIKNDGRVRRVIESLSEKHIVHLFYINGDESDKDLFNQSVTLHSRKKTGGWMKINLLFHLRFSELKEIFLSLNDEFDFIYCNDYPLLHLCTELKAKTKAKLIYDSHEIYIETINQFFPLIGWKSIYGNFLVALNKKIHAKVERNAVKKVDLMITVCDSFKDYFTSKLSISNIHVVKNCPKQIEVNRNPLLLREMLKLTDHDKILLYQGDINISRGIEKIANSMKYINKDVHFVVLGGGTKLNEFKVKYSSDRIHFLGKVPFEVLYEYTTSCDVGILLIESFNLSKQLTLPNKVFEYMVAGKPFITNELPEASKIVEEENCGFVINDTSRDSTANGINSAFENSSLEQLGENGYQSIVDKYNWESEVKKLIEYVDAN